MAKKQKVEIPQDVDPVIEEPTVAEKEVLPEVVEFIPSPEVVEHREIMLVDKALFFKMFKTCVSGFSYTGHSAVGKFGAMMGGKNQAECYEKWKECQAFIAGTK
jgi:hypothetical protein